MIRDAKKDDLLGVARVKIDTWNTTYRGLIPDDILDSFDCNDQADKFESFIPQNGERTFLIVAEEDSKIIGFAAGGEERTGKYGVDGEVYAVYVLEEYQNRGIGKMLMSESAARLAGMGFGSLIVWVLEENSYRRFYEKNGGEFIDKKPLEMENIGQMVVAYAWRDINALRDS